MRRCRQGGAFGAGRRAAAVLMLAVMACAGAGAAGAGQDRAKRAPVAAAPARDRFDVVVIDAGHGGDDEGARGPSGLLEKDLVLDVAQRVARLLREHGTRVVLTRADDRYVGLEERTSIGNDAHADLFLSIHANAASARGARGIETYFASLEASDESARQLARLENEAFREQGVVAAAQDDPLVAILGDLIATEHLTDAQEFARLAQGELAEVDLARSRGVKQAPFVVLMGVQMPSALVEIGFITNPADELALRRSRRREVIAEALVRALREFGRRYDARRGISAERAAGGGG